MKRLGIEGSTTERETDDVGKRVKTESCDAGMLVPEGGTYAYAAE